MACRFPGSVTTPDQFWQALEGRVDAVTEIGDDRWSTTHYYHPDVAEPGRTYTWSAGVLEGIDRFDADFFGISPREAAQMDPQQRILLELSWEALESGGQVPDRLAGSQCAVYVGISGTDYANSRLDDPASGDAYVMTGGTLSIAANRISYVFDLHGPSMAVDTACSSSLVALHEACASIWRGEADCALTGGMNLLMTPFNFIGFAKASMLSPTGRCRAFDARGDGYVRAEGGAMLFLKPLRAAEADGDPIHAVILGSAVNSDGRTRGLSMPSTEAQEVLLRTAYAGAGVTPDDLVYLEAHGTGTAAGDPQEAGAIGRALATARRCGSPLPIGSVKSNIGHLEPASGVAGLIKVVMSLKHGMVPPTIHFESPNPNIPFDELNLRVVSEPLPLPAGSPWVMGVNSFGFGGTNAHVVVRGYSVERRRKQTGRRRRPSGPLLLSARCEGALEDMARAVRGVLLSDDAPDLADLHYTAARRRQHHTHRLAVYGRDADEIAEQLEQFAEQGRGPGIASGRIVGSPAKVAFLFSGNGSQWPGMARRLLATDTRFRRTVERIDELLQSIGGLAVIDELKTDPARSRLALTEVAQPALFAIQVGLLESLRARGLVPQAVLGHSVGEVAAAYASGALTLEQAVRVIHERSAAQAPTRGLGRMAAVGLSPQEAAVEIAALGADVELAAVNSAGSVTLSGSFEALEGLRSVLEPRSVFCRILDLDYAFHSRVMDPAREPLVQSLADLRPGDIDVPFVSTVTGEWLGGGDLGAEYWWDNVRKPVRLDKAIAALTEEDIRVVVEIGPHPIMQSYVRENFRTLDHDGVPIATLQRDVDDYLRLMETLGAAHVHGCKVDLAKLHPHRGRFVSMPTYPWQRESYWYENTNEALGVLGMKYDHPLLGHRLAQTEDTWENQIDLARFPYLADHVVGGAAVFPAAGFIEMAIAASAIRHQGPGHDIENLEIRAPLLLNPGEPRMVRLTLAGDGGDFTIRSRPRLSDQGWTVHVVGRLAGPPTRRTPAPVNVSSLLSGSGSRRSAEFHYAAADAVGLCYGPAFRTVREVRASSDGADARLVAPESIAADLESYHLHPSILDGCLQVLVDVCAEDQDPRDAVGFVPYQLGRLVHHGRGGRVAFCRVRLVRRSPRSILADLQLVDASGHTLVELDGFRFRRMRLARPGQSSVGRYEFRPLLKPRREEDAGAILPRPTEIAEGLVEELTEQWYAQRRADYHGQVVPLLDALVSAFAYDTVHELCGGRRRFTLDSLARTAGVLPEHVPLLARVLKILEEDGLLEVGPKSMLLAEGTELGSPEEIWRLVVADFPAYLPEATLVGRCGMHLVAVMRGETDPAALLRSERGDATELLYDGSPTMRIMNRAVRDALQAIIAELPDGRRLRVLEVGGVSVGLAADVAAVLPSDRFEYVMACPDEVSHARVAGELSHCRGMTVTTLDVSTELADLDAACKPGFDVVIASHALHGCKDVELALANVRRLLARDGLLLLLERTPERFSDVAFGIEPSWWARTEKAEEPRSLLVPAEDWQRVLSDNGFADVVPLSEPAPDTEASGFLVIARNADPVETAAERAEERRFLVLTDAGGASAEIGAELLESLHSDGESVVLVRAGRRFERLHEHEFRIDAQSAEDFRRLVSILVEEGLAPHEIVHLFGLRLGGDHDGVDPVAEQLRRCASAKHVVEAFGTDGQVDGPRLWLVTAGGCAVPPSAAMAEVRVHAPSQAGLWGFGRVLMNEHADLHCRLLDLQIEGDAALAARLLIAELRHPDEEDEILRTADARYGLRIAAAPHGDEETSKLDVATATDCAIRLDFPTPGPLANLRWYAEPRRAPAAGEIEIRVHATGLNFRDVMYAMGMLSDEAVENGFAGPTLGMECAGEVVRVGPDVTGFRIQDPVVAFAPACFGTFVTTATTAVAHKPTGWSFQEAATIPSTFFTVYYALHHLAQLQAGEKVLIHGAAGGVGLAAIQYARFRGAEIFATAGSDAKRDFLRLLGVDHILDSRSLAFADEIMEITDGAGVDVVLNSLSGEAVLRNLNVLRPFGRFLELGKRDFYENAKVGLRPFRNNISYFGIDADQLLVERSALAGRLFREMMTLFEQRAFRPLVHRVFPSARVADAFRHMQQSRHIGKIVVTYDDQVAVRTPSRGEPAEVELRRDGTYLVTGGLGGFGLATARWLARRGARHLALVGRSGAASEAAQEAVRDLEKDGVQVSVHRADVADRDALAGVLASIDRDQPPLRGVVHAAMVLADGLLRNLGVDELEKVLRPKVQGAWNLHLLTRERPLDFFVMYSSATTAFGNPGQSNYVAANLYLESLAEHRRAAGLPACAIGWGPIEDVGVLAGNDAVREALSARIGAKALDSGRALAELGRILGAGESTLAVVDLDWRTVTRTLPAGRAPKFADVTRLAGEDAGDRGGGASIHELIADLSDSEVVETVVGLLAEQVANVLRLPVEKLDVDSSIYDLGMDSLMAVELHMGIEDRFGINVPIMAVTEGASIAQLGERIAAQVTGTARPAERGAAATPRDQAVTGLISRHGESFTPEEVDELVQDLMEGRDVRKRLIQ